MSRRTLPLTDPLHEYLLSVSLRESDVQRRLREETAGLAKSGMQISPEQGQLMALLVKLTAAKRILEVGTFTGYSALAMALVLPADGTLITCDVSEEWTAMARRYWTEAGVADRIDLRIGAARETLAALRDAGEGGSFDLAFIDADKTSYDRYYELCLELLRPGGLILIDNVLWGGHVLMAETDDDETLAIQALNCKLHTDDRIDVSLVPIGDGLTLARRR